MRLLLVIVILFLNTCTVLAQAADKHVRKANKLYRQGKFDESLREYELSVTAQPGNPVTAFNRGNALYRKGRFDEAAESYETPVADASAEFRQKALYNTGVAFSREQKLEQSIAAYKQALVLNPGDQDARVNLQKDLEELRRRQPPPPEPKEQQTKKQKEQEQKQPRQSRQQQSKLTRRQVEQLLKALDQREQQVQQKMQQNRSRSAGRQEKDW